MQECTHARYRGLTISSPPPAPASPLTQSKTPNTTRNRAPKPPNPTCSPWSENWWYDLFSVQWHPCLLRFPVELPEISWLDLIGHMSLCGLWAMWSQCIQGKRARRSRKLYLAQRYGLVPSNKEIWSTYPRSFSGLLWTRPWRSTPVTFDRTSSTVYQGDPKGRSRREGWRGWMRLLLRCVDVSSPPTRYILFPDTETQVYKASRVKATNGALIPIHPHSLFADHSISQWVLILPVIEIFATSLTLASPLLSRYTILFTTNGKSCSWMQCAVPIKLYKQSNDSIIMHCPGGFWI